MADENAADCIKQNLLELAPKIISVAEKRKLTAKDALELLEICHPSDDDDVDENITDGIIMLVVIDWHFDTGSDVTTLMTQPEVTSQPEVTAPEVTSYRTFP